MAGAIDLPLDTPRLDKDLPQGARLSRTIHPSGLRVLTEQVPGSHSTSIGFWVGVGSRDEDHVAYGSTHFLEHLLFKGTPSRTALDIAVAFDRIGGEHNALTAKEHTCYYARVQDRDVLAAIDVLADMVSSSVIDPVEFDVERRVILEELAMAADDPNDVAHEAIALAVHGDHPLGRPIGGNPQTIEAAHRDQVVAHYRHYYRPDQLVVTVAGALEHDQVVDQVVHSLTTYGWDLNTPSQPAPRRSTLPAEGRASEPRRIIHRPLEQSVVVLATPGLTHVDQRRPAAALLTTALGGGMSSRLFQEVREKRGLAYSVYSFASHYSDSGMFGMAAGTNPDQVSEVVRVMKQVYSDIASEGITEEERERTLGNLQGSSSLALESTDARMVRLGRSEIHTGEFVDREEMLERLEAVTLADIQVLAGTWASQPLSAVVVGDLADGSLDSVGESIAD